MVWDLVFGGGTPPGPPSGGGTGGAQAGASLAGGPILNSVVSQISAVGVTPTPLTPGVVATSSSLASSVGPVVTATAPAPGVGTPQTFREDFGAFMAFISAP